MAKYKLIIQRHFRKSNKELGTIFLFGVQDTDKGAFPLGFVCKLPKTGFNKSAFADYFKDPINKAIELLTQAREEYTNEDFQQEISNRLEDLRLLKEKEAMGR